VVEMTSCFEFAKDLELDVGAKTSAKNQSGNLEPILSLSF
jgi:hypothetical protein